MVIVSQLIRPVLVLLLILLTLYSRGAHANDDSARNVILITLDGVRVSEFLGEVDSELDHGGDTDALFPYFWGELSSAGEIYGDIRERRLMTVANPSMVSLPAYMSIMAGTPQLCDSNECGSIQVETLQDRIIQDLELAPSKVASIASWGKMRRAIASRDTSFVNAGVEPVTPHDGGDRRVRELNTRQALDLPPWSDARYDRFTMAHALRYLTNHKPRFLFIGLNDADEWGHKIDYRRYLGSLRQYDTWLRDLVLHLESLGAYGRNTCLIVTTDHGRGLGHKWYTHSNGSPFSGLVLMYIGCPLNQDLVRLKDAPLFSTHLDIRPTVESILGLEPTRCLACGVSLIEED